MKIIRQNTFETNSSSTHSITMCMANDYNKWKNGELYYINDTGEFVDEINRIRVIKEHIIHEKSEYNDGLYTYKGVSVKYDNLNELYTEENLNEITQEEIEEFLGNEYDYWELPLTYEEWDGLFDYEKYEDSYTTPNGDEVISFGYYGSDY